MSLKKTTMRAYENTYERQSKAIQWRKSQNVKRYISNMNVFGIDRVWMVVWCVHMYSLEPMKRRKLKNWNGICDGISATACNNNSNTHTNTHATNNDDNNNNHINISNTAIKLVATRKPVCMKNDDKVVWEKEYDETPKLIGILIQVRFYTCATHYTHPHSWTEAHMCTPLVHSIVSVCVCVGGKRIE